MKWRVPLPASGKETFLRISSMTVSENRSSIIPTVLHFLLTNSASILLASLKVLVHLKFKTQGN